MLVLGACSTSSPSASASNQPGAESQAAASTSASPPQNASPQIAVSGEHACALPGDGTVRCWGLNYFGELGDGTQTDINTAGGDTLPLDAVTVIAGAGSSDPLADVVAIGAGLRHTCAVLADSTVKCWGWNSRIDDPIAITGNGGQVGDGTTIDRLAPVTVVAAAGSADPLSGVQAVAAGWFHTCALMLDATVKCWGTNEEGQLGDGTTTNSTAPVTVITAPGSTSPLSGVMAIAAGDFRTCALLADTTVTCWGWNYVSQLDPATGSEPDLTPVAVSDSASGGVLSGVTAVAVAGGFTQDVGGFLACALMTSQSVKCWGANDNGSLGDGTTTSSLAAVDVVGLPGPATAITGGCALLADTTVACWPQFDAGGQLVNAPALVVDAAGSTTPLTGVTTLALGNSQRCAILDDGSVRCWSSSGVAPTTVPGLLITSP
jgi:alpha-tubulin suppressor-like RCC1 family protein